MGNISSVKKISKLWKRRLDGCIDGIGLKEASKVPNAHQWVGDGTSFLSGRDYIQSIQTRINAIPCRSRLARGRIRDRQCSAGCSAVESSNHILQCCHRTHGFRINRHNAVCSYIIRGLINRNEEVFVEPNISVGDSHLKPDIIVKRGDTAAIVDVQVVNDYTELKTSHHLKKTKYMDTAFLQSVRSFYNLRSVEVTTVTLNWRGVWSLLSSQDLLRLNIVKKSDLKVISSRVIIGSATIWRAFGCMIGGVRAPRMGVG